MTTKYEYTHISWRHLNEDGTVSNMVHVIHDRERAADEVKELMLNPDVFAVRALHYPCADPEGEEYTAHQVKIGPPTTA